MSIDKIIIENFKIFEGQHIFDLNELNIFTGANNSGKSTLFQAINLFSKGLEKGDFPEVELFDLNVENHQNLINRNSNGNSFKIGFFIDIGIKPKQFKVLFEFTEDNTYSSPTGNIQFSSFEIVDLGDEVLFGVYIVDKFKITKENIEYEFDTKLHKKSQELPFQTPSEMGEPGSLMTRVNIDMLEKHISDVTTHDFSIFLKHIKDIRGKYNNWWAELFYEGHYETSDITKLTLQDLLQEYARDEYYNLADNQTKDILYWDKENVDENWEEYLKLKEGIKYIDFLNEVISPILESVKYGLNFFRNKNFAHITTQTFNDELISKSTFSKYLFSLIPGQYNSGLAGFSRKALGIFNIDGFVDLESHLNSSIEINLVTGLKETDLILDEKFNKLNQDKRQKKSPKVKPQPENITDLDSLPAFRGIFVNYKKDYEKNLRQNIATLGKGTSNLIGIISKVFSILDEHKQKQQRNWVESKKRKKVKRFESQIEKLKLILIEEPEIYLHPDWQSKLADFLLYCLNYSKEYKVKFLVETHSVYLIQRLQFLVATGKIPHESISVLFFNSDSEKDKFYEMGMRMDGIFKNKFGSGFYDETAKLTVDILNAKSLN